MIPFTHRDSRSSFLPVNRINHAGLHSSHPTSFSQNHRHRQSQCCFDRVCSRDETVVCQRKEQSTVDRFCLSPRTESSPLCGALLSQQPPSPSLSFHRRSSKNAVTCNLQRPMCTQAITNTLPCPQFGMPLSLPQATQLTQPTCFVCIQPHSSRYRCGARDEQSPHAGAQCHFASAQRHHAAKPPHRAGHKA